ncbi:nucleotide exchange factor GrpE [Bacteroidota bacterium]
MSEEKNINPDEQNIEEEAMNNAESNTDSKAEENTPDTKKGKKAATNKKIKELEGKIDELNDKYLRLFSEFDNYRKRTLKEKVILRETAAEDMMVGLLPVLDDFERALQVIGETEVDTNFKEGVLLIFNKFITFLTQKGLEQMKTIGEEFDTDFHEAITSIPAPSPDMKGKVVDEVEKGYILNGKVIRYAKVVIGN